MTSITTIINDIKKLDPISSITHHLLDVIDDKNSTSEDIAEIIQYEPTVTANVLRTCNAAFYGRKDQINSIKDAVLLVGMDRLADIVIMQSGRQALLKAEKEYGEHEGVLWKFSISSALLAKQLAIQTNAPNKNLLFTAALIKDLGKMVLGRFIKGSIQKINNLVEKKNYTFSQAEKVVIGIDHAELGGLIAESWKFSPRMGEIIRNHHSTDRSIILADDIAIVYLADKICMMMGLGGWIDRNDNKLYNAAMKTVGFHPEDLPEVIADFSYGMQEVEELLRVI